MSDFFRINMPYGMQRNEKGKWMFFNREYMPLGLQKKNVAIDDQFVNANEDRYYLKYKGITEKFLLSVMETAGEREHCDRNNKGEIVRLWFYCDATTPAERKIDNDKWKSYTERLKKLYALTID